MSAKRVTIDLSEQLATELEQLKESTGMKTCDIFHHGFKLLTIYCAAIGEKRELRVVDPDGNAIQTRIELPFFVISEKS